MTKEDIEQKIESFLDNFVIGLKQHFQYRFWHNPGGNLADCIIGITPPMITFYSERIRQRAEQMTEAETDALIEKVIIWQLSSTPIEELTEDYIQNFRENFYVKMD